MKKLYLFILLATITSTAQAQWFSIGAKAGYSSTFKSENIQETFNVTKNLQNGFHVGAFARLGRSVFVQPEVLYNFLSYDSDIKIAGTTIAQTKKYKVGTIDVPVLLGGSLVNTKMFKLRLMAGPKFSFNAGSTKGIDSFDAFTQTVRNARLGLDAGMGFDIWKITLDLRYNLIQNLYKIELENGITANDNLLHSIQASVGFRFGNNLKKQKTKNLSE